MNQSIILVVTDIHRPDHRLSKSLYNNGFKVQTTALSTSCEELITKDKDIVAIVWDVVSPKDVSLLSQVTTLNRDNLAKFMVSEKTSIETKIKHYQAGIDMFFEKPVELAELVCTIANLTGKISRLNRHNDNVKSNIAWTLQSSEWHLLTPTYHHIALTQKERCFLVELMLADNLTVSKEQLLKKLGYEAKGIHGRKAMDVMLTRLRRKIKNTSDLDVPIKTVYQQGFQFTAPFCVEQ